MPRLKMTLRAILLSLALSLVATPGAQAAEKRFGICGGLDHACVITALQYSVAGKYIGWKFHAFPISVGVQVQGFLLPPESSYRPYLHYGSAGVAMGAGFVGAGAGVDWRLRPDKRAVVSAQFSLDAQGGANDDFPDSLDDFGLKGSIGMSFIVGKLKAEQ